MLIYATGVVIIQTAVIEGAVVGEDVIDVDVTISVEIDVVLTEDVVTEDVDAVVIEDFLGSKKLVAFATSFFYNIILRTYMDFSKKSQILSKGILSTLS